MNNIQIIRIFSFLFLLCTFTTSNAQFGKLKDKLIRKKGNINKVKLDFSSSPYKPAITMQSLLGGGIHLTVDGKLTTKDLHVNLLPTKTTSGAKANYDEYKKENLLLHAELISTKTQKVIGKYHYSVNPVMKVGSVMNQKKVNDNGDFFYKIGVGTYELKFCAGGEHFYTFPFEVIAIQNEDAYATFSEVLFLKGAWEDWAYFDIQQTVDEKRIIWHHFMDNTTTDIENEFRTESKCDYQYRYELFRNGQLFGAQDSRMTASKNAGYNLKVDYATQGAIRTKWLDKNVQISKIPGDKHHWDKLTLEDFSDGNYEMVLHTIDCANYKKARVFPFKVANGKIVYHKQQDRKTHKDHTTIVEGGRDQYWFKVK
ncbi:MAG: hypothetical protein AB8B69_20585 [Chitinophagales bacterium]